MIGPQDVGPTPNFLVAPVVFPVITTGVLEVSGTASPGHTPGSLSAPLEELLDAELLVLDEELLAVDEELALVLEELALVDELVAAPVELALDVDELATVDELVALPVELTDPAEGPAWLELVDALVLPAPSPPAPPAPGTSW